MQDRKHVAWLYQQLPELVRDGTLDSDAAARLRRRYGEVDISGRNRAIVIFGILGAALIGGGVILLIAHNWDELSRATRTALSFAPMLAGQALCGWTLLRRPESAAWREGAGTFLTLAIGSSIALVAQTYHLGGSLEDFLLTWALLGLPVAYLMEATLPALLYLVAIVTWSGLTYAFFWRDHGGAFRSLAYWGLLALVLPWWLLRMREGLYRSKVTLFGWVLALTLPIGFFFSMERFALGYGWPVWQSGFWIALFLAGEKWWGDATTSAQRPLQTVGGLGAFSLALALTFEDLWKLHEGEAASGVGLVLVIAWLLASLALLADAVRRKATAQVLLGALPVVIMIGYFLANASPWAAVALMNLYVLGLGVGVLSAGLRAQRLGTMNAGMTILSALIFFRFFDADIGFVARGIAFILIGAGFLGANLTMLRKRGAAK